LRLRRIVLAVLVLAGCQTSSGTPPTDTPEDRFAYALGARLGSDVQKTHPELDREQVLRGVEDGLAGNAALSDEEINAALKEGVEAAHARQDAHWNDRALQVRREGEAFLAQNTARAGVVTLPSGLQYEVVREGSGPVPGTEDFVTCHYRGTLLDGTVFDDTGLHGGPRTFQLTAVVDGFEEALLRMPQGARWKLWVPPDLAYGERGAGSKVPPNAVLVFDVELLAVGD
jgi:FKBP-type peptidyl-prolyl cis-trans isomerase FklB